MAKNQSVEPVNMSIGQPMTTSQRRRARLNASPIYQQWTGQNVASTPATQSYAARSGVGVLSTPSKPQYGPTRTLGPVKPTSQIPVKSTQKATSAVVSSTSTPSATSISPSISKETQAGIDADKMGLTGSARQAFIEGKNGVSSKTADSKISLISPVTSAVSSTDTLRANRAATQADATSLYGDITGLSDTMASSVPTNSNDTLMSSILASKSFGDTTEGKTMMQNIVDMQTKLASGEYTDEEKARIKEDADATQAQYDALAQEAEQNKASGMASSLVTAGQRGGLMNSQFSGVASDTSTAGRNFFGAGGELNRIQSDYDSQISSIRAQGIKAVADAKSAAEEAIRTGRKEDLEAAQSLYEMAKAAHDDELSVALQKQQAMASYQNQLIELEKYNRDTASATITALAASGKSADEIPDWYFEDMDKQSGYKEGTSKALYDITAKEYSQKTATDAIEQAQALNNLLTSIPVGEKITIGDTTYQSLNKGETSVYSEDDGNGNLTIYSVNKDTGVVETLKTLTGISAVDGEIVTNNGVTAFVSKTGGVKVIYDANQPNGGIATGGLIEAFPQDSYSSFTDENGVPRTQCGEWVNDVTGLGVGDSLASKVAKIDSSITTENAQVGDVIVTSEGGSTGHVAIINSISYDTNGNPVYTVSESNYKKDKNGIGVITHDRTISGDSRLIKGYARPGFKDDSYNFGTDSSALKRLFAESEDELTTAQKASTFNNIVAKYNSSPLVMASDRLPVLESSIAAIEEDPSNAAQQLNLSYAYIQALDTYQSAVREGELGLVNSIDSKIGQLSNYVTQMGNGQIVRPEVALQVAQAAKNIVDTIKNAASQKAQSFASQANVAGVGDEWDQYISGFNQNYSTSGVDTNEVQDYGEYGNYVSSKLSGVAKADGSELTQAEIAQIAQAAQNALDAGNSQEDILDTINSYLGY